MSRRYVGRGPGPRRFKEVGKHRKVGAECAQLLGQIELVAAEDAVEVDVAATLDVLARLAAVVDSVDQRVHLFERIGLIKGLFGVVLVEPRVALDRKSTRLNSSHLVIS